jgi:hypothetical protein
MAAHEAGWRNATHRQQWHNTLRTYAYPIIGKLSADAIDTGLVRQILTTIWAEKNETASWLRGRIEVILDWGTHRVRLVTAALAIVERMDLVRQNDFSPAIELVGVVGQHGHQSQHRPAAVVVHEITHLGAFAWGPCCSRKCDVEQLWTERAKAGSSAVPD